MILCIRTIADGSLHTSSHPTLVASRSSPPGAVLLQGGLQALNSFDAHLQCWPRGDLQGVRSVWRSGRSRNDCITDDISELARPHGPVHHPQLQNQALPACVYLLNQSHPYTVASV